ncbi:related to GDA1 - guanosine diphosphatase [Ustilago trichophora]|uniref:guanosine-diphosphatase n=1 Tax=Ustilago trichophora TaxID=86804 RepID=A0A5C3DPU8_9BASI|nr:related to GDA1 - guanosine diphosphatase [Ustilago trichophora]
MSHSPSQTSPRRAPPASGKKHYRAKSISRSSVDLDNSETGALLLAPNGLSSEGDDHIGYPPHSSAAGAAGVSSRSWSTRRMPLGSRRLAIILFGFVALIVLFGRRDSRDAVVGYVNDKAGQVGQVYQNAPWKAKPDSNAVGFPVSPPASATPAKAPVTGTSADTVRQKPALHPDPSKTTRCDGSGSRPLDHKGNPRPLVQYALMIDAGSTGSRIHVYRFNYCSESPELEDEYFEMLKGGLSNYGTNPAAAADSLRPLLNSALARVPHSLRKCTPVAVKATAGLRLLPGKQAEDVIKAVRHMLENEYPFPIADGKNADGSKGSKGVEIMEGKDEGVFAWITVNYLLNRIGSSSADKLETAAVMDLGGGSTQIVFEPSFPSALQGMHPGEHVYQLNAFGTKPYTLYQNSYLGYGLMQARMSINSLAAFTYSLAHPNAVLTGSAHDGAQGSLEWSSLRPETTRIPSPCFTNGRTKAVLISQPGQKTQANVTMVGTDGGFAACRRLVEVMMDKDAVCTSKSCSFGGVYQPSLMETFKTAPIIALSYFYDRLEPLGLGPKFKISDLEAVARRACAYSKVDTQGFSPKAIAELEDRPETCLDLSFMHGLLSLGYELSGDREVSIAKKLGGTELGWCLGAQLAVLDEDGLLCKA